MSTERRDRHIASMYRRDVAVGVSFATLMWLTLVFVFVMALRVVPDARVTTVMGVAMVCLGVFNTLSVLSLIRRYDSEREAIYGDDLFYLELARSERSARRATS